MGAAAVQHEDLDALFDLVAAQSAAARLHDGAAARLHEEAAATTPSASLVALPAAPAAQPDADSGSMFHRVGQLTRTLHDALHELGYDRNLASAVQDLPDARDRLNYIATLTGQAAERALGAVERGQAVQKALEETSAPLAKGWDELYAGSLSVEEFKALAGRTREFLGALPQRTGETSAQLHEIMMAQDFHDLTGQVISRVISLAQSLEAQLVALLIDARPAESRAGEPPSVRDTQWLTGPAINAAGRSDVVANQAQVDELLESLGF